MTAAERLEDDKYGRNIGILLVIVGAVIATILAVCGPTV